MVLKGYEKPLYWSLHFKLIAILFHYTNIDLEVADARRLLGAHRNRGDTVETIQLDKI